MSDAMSRCPSNATNDLGSVERNGTVGVDLRSLARSRPILQGRGKRSTGGRLHACAHGLRGEVLHVFVLVGQEHRQYGPHLSSDNVIVCTSVMQSKR